MEAISNSLKNNSVFAFNMAKQQEQVQEKENSMRSFKSYLPISYDQFKQLLSANAYEIMLRRSVRREFEVDRHNEPILRQLYLYFTNDPACGWNLNAGIIFGGKMGCGKSLMMMAYLGVSDQYSRKLTTQVHSKTLGGLIRQNGMETYVRRPLFIDELGREESEVKDYGNIVKPVIDLFGLRYEEGSRTYATTNFNYNSLQNFYSEYIRTRMEEMMTYVQFPGESRRLKNEVKTR
jgi:DNA replication protein DnaC